MQIVIHHALLVHMSVITIQCVVQVRVAQLMCVHSKATNPKFERVNGFVVIIFRALVEEENVAHAYLALGLKVLVLIVLRMVEVTKVATVAPVHIQVVVM